MIKRSFKRRPLPLVDLYSFVFESLFLLSILLLDNFLIEHKVRP